jgi:hypothetical protein
LAAPLEPDWRRGLLIRRCGSAPQERQASVVCAPPVTPLAAVVRVAGLRGTIAPLFEVANGNLGLERDEVRRGTGWYRHVTLARWALARLPVLRAGGRAVELVKLSLSSCQPHSGLTAFKASRGLGSP